LLYKSYLNISDATVSSLQEQNFLPRGTQSSMVVPQMEVVNALRGMGFQAAYQAPSWENNGKLAEFSATRIPNTTWILVMAQPVSAINTLIQSQTRTLVTSSAIIIIFTAVIALLASNFFTSPIVQLTNVAEKISAGDFSQKANVRSNDEIGVLGRTFNTMTTQIQELIENLEKRVETRTAELEQTTLQSEKRARELQTITDISRYISTEKDLEKLLPLITKSVSEQFGFYHVGIFLLSENKKYAVLRAANSPGGQRMLRRQHKLEVGQTGIVGNVTATGIPRIAHDTGADAIYFNNPDLPETRSEMALPLSVHGTVTGALDVQSTRPNAFTDSDITLLSLLADQIATAIENARLLEESQRALAESQSVFREYITEAWQKKTVSGVMGYYHTLAGGQLLTNKIVNEIDVTFEDESNVLGVPIRLRDQVIGTLQIKSKKENKSLSADEVSIVESVAERLGLALDSARLFEETSTRASRERLVTDITAKIRSTNDPQEMIKTAMEELKRALGAQQVEIVPQKIKPMSDR
jgi:GAF domain-containing protein/HAMP domain-containing protein